MALLAKIDPKYDALGSQSRVASRGDPEMTALLEEEYNKIHLEKNVSLGFFMVLHCIWDVLSYEKKFAKV